MPVLEGWIGHSVDVAIVGAGSAGIAAALHLGRLRPDLTCLVLEASGRIGGRACTLAGPTPLDLGCGWLHGATTNAWTRVADELGFVIDKLPPPWSGGSRALGVSADDKQAADDSIRRYFDRVDARRVSGLDPPLSAFLEPGDPWSGLIGAIGTFINGVELDHASTLDYDHYEPGPPPDWRVRDGYGRLVARAGAEVPVVLDAPVQAIVHRERSHVGIETHRGTLQCRAVIVTISTDLMASQAIRFDPACPSKQAAAASLPLGLANKLFLHVADAEHLPNETHLLGTPFRVATGAYHVRPFGRPVIEAYYGGDLAHNIETGGPDAALDFAAEELSRHFGTSIRPSLSVHAASAWAENPWARGSYSYAKPGQSGSRAALAAPIDDRLFFAGEASSPNRFSTAHGAYETGVRAAEQVSAVL